jgi:hypothetical protein
VRELTRTYLAQNPPPKANGPPHDKNGGQVVREVPLTQRLTEDQRKGATPDLFEQSIAAAFAFLGFEATHVGGPGNTDVFARAPLGSETYSTTIDGKSSQNGKITNGQIDWYAIEGHREANKAKYAAVIGESLAGGDLLRNAQKSMVVLITTPMLCEILQLHAICPFTLFDVEVLFQRSGLADDRYETLQERHARSLRHWQLISEIVDKMEKMAPAWPDGFTSAQMRLLFSAEVASGARLPAGAPSLQDVTDAMVVLSSREVGALKEVQGSPGSFQLTMTADSARLRVQTLAEFLRPPTVAKV